MTSLTYSGPIDAVDVKLPDRWLSAVRGEAVDVTDKEAERLLDLPGWAVTEPATDDSDEENER